MMRSRKPTVGQLRLTRYTPAAINSTPIVRASPRHIFGLQIPPAFENLERVFLIGEAKRLRLFDALHRDIARRRTPCGAAGGAP